MNITSNLTSNQNTLAKTSASETMKAITSKTVTTTEEQSVAKNRDTLTLSAQYTSNYTENDLSDFCKSYTAYQLEDMMNSSTSTSDRMLFSKEITVRNTLGYTRDLDATINGKLKDMQDNTDYDYCQTDWGYDLNEEGDTVSCAVTAVAAMLSLNGNPTEPTDIPTDSMGTFENGWPTNLVNGSNSVSDVNTESEALAKIRGELSQGKAVVIHVQNHWVTAVGVKEGVDLSNAGLSDLYIFDPGTSRVGSEVCTYSFDSDHRVVTTK